jgi:hypothetical protein
MAEYRRASGGKSLPAESLHSLTNESAASGQNQIEVLADESVIILFRRSWIFVRAGEDEDGSRYVVEDRNNANPSALPDIHSSNPCRAKQT